MNKRFITYREAINEALRQEMERDKSVFTYGIDVADHKRIFGTSNGLLEQFGKERCFSTPLCEDSFVGFGIGAAINGLRPVNTHMRLDFLILALNQLINIASTISYGSGGELHVPLVIRAIIGRGWGQGFQHSKSLMSFFAHVPGLKVVVPTLPSDAKGLLIAAIRDNNPVVVIEHRWLYDQEGEVPKEPFTIPFGVPQTLREGTDITIVATSWMNVESRHAAEILAKFNVSVEIIDPRTLAPLNDKPIIDSVKKTGRCLIVDNDWVWYGISAEIATRIYEQSFKNLKSPVQRLGFAHTPCPTARHLENEFYPNAKKIVRAVEKMLGLPKIPLHKEEFYSYENKFRGPF